MTIQSTTPTEGAATENPAASPDTERVLGLPHPVYGDGIVPLDPRPASSIAAGNIKDEPGTFLVDGNHSIWASTTISAVEAVARQCALDMGVDWRELSDRARDGYAGLAASALAGTEPYDPHVVDTFGGGVMASGPEFEKAALFQAAVLAEFRESPIPSDAVEG